MYSKGVQFYAYQGGEFSVEVEQPTHKGTQKARYTYGPNDTMLQANLEISGDDIGDWEHTGRFQWTAQQHRKKLEHTRYAEISPLTGNLGASNLGVMLETRSVVKPEYALSYGFYDAGSGLSGLTNHHQSYVYLTRNHARWMGDLVVANPHVGQRPFGTLVLPGAHDAGMFDPTTLDTLLRNAVLGGRRLGLSQGNTGTGLEQPARRRLSRWEWRVYGTRGTRNVCIRCVPLRDTAGWRVPRRVAPRPCAVEI